MADTITLRILRFLPKNLLSRSFGWFASWRRPRWFVRPFMRWFARRFGLDLGEAARPFEEYESLLAMFTRELKPGARPIDADPGVTVSPVDAKVGAFGRVDEGNLYQAKGMQYTIAALVGARDAAALAHGSYLTLYLSPRDYHRIHSPSDGRIARTLYHAGTLWPVNPPAVRSIPQLFAVNERATTLIETPRGLVAVVMVGATNVGSIRLAYADFVTNCGADTCVLEHSPAIGVVRGSHIGTFELGSTVVLLMADPKLSWNGFAEGDAVKMGQAIARSDAIV
jgi:phosphatidylserine decarboxylase